MTHPSWSQGNVTSDGVKVHYHRTGNGSQPALLLIHGFTDNGLCWSRCAKALEHAFDVIMVDARNHGESACGPATLDALAKDHAAVVTELGFSSIAVIGHSVGASVAARLAGDYPALVSQLVLEDPPWRHEPPDQTGARDKRAIAFGKYVDSVKGRTIQSIIEEGRRRHPNWHPDEFGHWAESNQQVHRDAMSLMDMGEWETLIPGITCPTLLLHADGDGIVTQETAQQIRAHNAFIQTTLVTGAGHNLRREQFDEFLQNVTAFLLT